MDSLDPRTPALAEVQSAYATWSMEYTDLFGSTDKASTEDRTVIEHWSKTVVGPVLDAGCGPGHWSAFLHSLGLQVEGVDATEAFVQHAAKAYPEITFRLGDLRTINPTPASLGGVLAWFSLIHLDPSEMPHVLHLISTALRPGGTLLIGFFSGTELRPFDHRIVTAWTWPLRALEHELEAAGLEVLARSERPQTSGRVLAELTARKPT